MVQCDEQLVAQWGYTHEDADQKDARGSAGGKRSAGQRWAALPSAAQRYFRYVDSGTDPFITQLS